MSILFDFKVSKGQGMLCYCCKSTYLITRNTTCYFWNDLKTNSEGKRLSSLKDLWRNLLTKGGLCEVCGQNTDHLDQRYLDPGSLVTHEYSMQQICQAH